MLICSLAVIYNNLLIIPVLIMASLVTEDWSSTNLAKSFPPDHSTSVFAAMFFTGTASIFISYASAWCIRATSSTTHSMVGALNKLPLAISGLLFFDAPVTISSVSAIAIGSVGGIVYAVAKNNARQTSPKSGILPITASTSASSRGNRDGLTS